MFNNYSIKADTIFAFEDQTCQKQLNPQQKTWVSQIILDAGASISSSTNNSTTICILTEKAETKKKFVIITPDSSYEQIKNTLEPFLEQEPNQQWKPWYPVIDYDRCTNCMQCLSFCLFDVYRVDEKGQIKVNNQQKCKTDCPACSRVCPEVAIIFPKYKHGPINGDEVKADDIRREKMKVDISSLLGGNIYDTLRDRTAKAKSRFSKERDEDKALKERKRCLREIKEQLDIPDEVLNALPSMENIQQKMDQMLNQLDKSLPQKDQP